MKHPGRFSILLIAALLGGFLSRVNAQCDTLFSSTGAVLEIGMLEDGFKDGLWTAYHPDGSIRSEGEFDNGIKHGTWTWYHANGQVSSVEKWKKGSYKKGKYWDENGQPSDISVVLTDAAYPGGLQAFRKLIAENVAYPEQVLDLGIEGRVVLTFQINSQGRVVNPVVKETAHPQLDQEAIRVVQLSDAWTPATFHGEYTATTFTFPITFALQ
ncbi:MAG: TonB family protein [Bacteroidales bacterium]